jgi:hypothetical protein
LTAGALVALGIQQARRAQPAEWIYGVVLFGGAVGVYIRLLSFGVAPVSVWDTAALMMAAYILLILQRLTQSEPLLRAVMVLPLLTLFTVPLQFASLHASSTLLTAGVLYGLAHHETNRPALLYLAMLAMNAAVYVWVPGWADRYHLFQVYTLPAVASGLLLLHLHRHELHPSVLNSTRLAATSILYASVMVDVFLRAELLIFVLALFLSLLGVVLGLALRTRAFLYSGVTFFALNVVGQLILLFPEQRLGKAIVLLVLGVAITGGMIWFNAQHELLLRRIRIVRADLATWE